MIDFAVSDDNDLILDSNETFKTTTDKSTFYKIKMLTDLNGFLADKNIGSNYLKIISQCVDNDDYDNLTENEILRIFGNDLEKLERTEKGYNIFIKSGEVINV